MTKADAKAFLLHINIEQSKGIFLEQQKLSVADYLRDWQQDYVEVNVRQTSRVGYERIIKNQLIPNIGAIELKDLRSSDIDRMYAHLLKSGRMDGKGGLSAKSVLYTHRVLSEALEHAVKHQLIYHNPAKEVLNVPKPKRFQGNIYTAEEIRNLMKVAEGSIFEVPITLAAVCGLRRGECLGLKEDDINFDEMTIKISRQLVSVDWKTKISEPKTSNSNRVISAPNEVFDILRRKIEYNHRNREWLGSEYHDDGWVVCHDDGTFIAPGNFTKNFAYFIKSHGLKPIRFHDLRHSAASLMLTAGVPMKVASQILGHSSISITADLYTHVLRKSKEEAAEKVGKVIFSEDTKSDETDDGRK